MSERIVRRLDNSQTSLITQHITGTNLVEHIRRHAVDMDPVMERVRYLNDKVNGAPRAGNRSELAYLGSVDRHLVDDWLRKEGYTWPQFGQNAPGKGALGVKDEFKAWFLSNPDLKKFKADTYGHNPRSVYAPSASKSRLIS